MRILKYILQFKMPNSTINVHDKQRFCCNRVGQNLVVSGEIFLKTFIFTKVFLKKYNASQVLQRLGDFQWYVQEHFYLIIGS